MLTAKSKVFLGVFFSLPGWSEVWRATGDEERRGLSGGPAGAALASPPGRFKPPLGSKHRLC